MVAFIDLQCPFCRNVQTTLDALVARYAARKLRVIYKRKPEVTPPPYN